MTGRRAVRVLVSGGGTAGHIYPALAVARLLGSCAGAEDEVAFVGAPDSLEQRLSDEAGLRFVGVRARGWDRARPWTLVTGVLTTVGSLARCVSLLRRERTDVVCGFGGFVSLPLGLAAVLSRVPLVIHEQNAVPGLANKVLARWAATVCLTYPESAGYLRGRVTSVVTGNPVRSSVLAADRDSGRTAFGVAANETLLLVFGGSRGARHLNTALVDLYPRLSDVAGLRVVQVAGPTEAAAVRAALAAVAGGAAPSWWSVREYVDAMGDLIAAADLVVCRAGATTLAELSVLAKPMVLVPYPYATDDHQTHNAHPFVEAGGAVLIEDSRLDESGFGEAVLGLLRDPAARAKMAAGAGSLGRPRAAEAVLGSVREASTGAGPETKRKVGS
jgi:UDP-N-acetylglucosamine--N-acetylmuramyl-(pentapeptide) pyrophosphoryl-undecaprenol N-acetylglucosamine transferase